MLPRMHYFGSGNWHRGDGTDWPNFGELENAARKWSAGKLGIPFPLRIQARKLCLCLGEGNDDNSCLDSVPLLEGFPAKCWEGDLPLVEEVQGGGLILSGSCETEITDMNTPGIIVAYGGETIPSGWLECDGAAVSRTTYAALFDAIGTVWGVGDGSTTFNIPDLRGRAPIGAGTGPGLSTRDVGDIGGEQTHTLTIAELAIHSHDLTLAAVTTNPPPAGPPIQSFSDSPLGLGGISGSEGDSQPHNNMQPFTVCKFMIRH